MATEVKQHFRFATAEIVLHSVFILSNACMAFFQLMPNVLASNPPDPSQLRDSFLTPLLDRQRDCHDDQWEGFRSNLPIMLALMFGWRYFIKAIAPSASQHRWMRSGWLGLGLLVFTFRADIFLYLTVLLLWFGMTKALCRYKIVIPLAWGAVIVFLYLNEQYDHLRFVSRWFEQFVPKQLGFFKNSQAPLLWTNIINMHFLKMLSFTMDSHWGFHKQKLEQHMGKCSECTTQPVCDKGRDLSRPPETSLKNYLDYMLYAPTCLAGPPISYTSFFSFDVVPTQTRPPYLRTFFLIAFFEIYLHFYPVVTPNKSQDLLQMGFSSLLFLYFISLKFTVIWRVGRMWSLMYGIDVIDNMGRCMFNNYGFERFWRMWHKGFNHWLIRYLYVPLGGNKNLLSVLCVILFVAFWHDHTIRILAWALILVLFMIPELAVKAYFRKYFSHLYVRHWFKYLCAFACSFYIVIICICNLVGFGYGVDNAALVLWRIQEEWVNFVYITLVLTSACVLMFYVREIERPRRND